MVRICGNRKCEGRRLTDAVRCDEKWAVLQRKTETAFIWECKPDLWEQEQDELFVDMT